jgi:SAM-dependent methyltransferase
MRKDVGRGLSGKELTDGGMGMKSKMDMHDLKRVNHLWGNIYPYLADQVLNYYNRRGGEVQEWGPFSGGISFALLNGNPDMKITIAVAEEDVYGLMRQEIEDNRLDTSITLGKSDLIPMGYGSDTFDLIVIRGAYFFLDPGGAALREIYRVMKPGAVAFVGGGYGEKTPQMLIDEIADESRILNDRLGRVRVTLKDLEKMIAGSALHHQQMRIIEDGGLWLLMEK